LAEIAFDLESLYISDLTFI